MYLMKLCSYSTEKVAFMSEVLTLERKCCQVVVKISYHLWLKENSSMETAPEHGKVIFDPNKILQDS